MPIYYDQDYDIQTALAQDPTILRSPLLYNLDDGATYAAMMDQLAQPLDDGTESPFSGRNPLSGYGQLTGMVVHMLRLFGHELNLTPDRTWLQLFRMLGIQLSEADYPVVNLQFTRSRDAVLSQIPAWIPQGTEIASAQHPGLSVITTATVEITGDDTDATVSARLNQPGALSVDIQPGEFSVLPQLLSFVSSVQNTDILYKGRNRETLPEAMLRTRQQMQIGRRCVTARDYYLTAINLGALKVNVVPGIQYGDGAYYSDLVTVVVYPAQIVPDVRDTMLDRVMLGTRLDVRAAEIIPIDGTIDVRIVPNLSNLQAFDVAATAIAQNVNPPYGNWADTAFYSTVATALEDEPSSIYAVPNMTLKNSVTGQPLQDIELQPWNLLEVQNSVQFNWIR